MINFSGFGWFRRRLRLLVVFAVVLLLVAAYMGSYYRLSRRGMREAKGLGMKGFLYIPAQEMIGEKDLSRHIALAELYALANAIDQALTGAEEPVRCILFRLSK